jgi:DNA mismatch endonuclease Vsr
MDRVSQEKRSAMMSRVRAKNTGPELAVRRVLHAMGFRFRLHKDDLPGKPDIVLPKKRLAIQQCRKDCKVMESGGDAPKKPFVQNDFSANKWFSVWGGAAGVGHQETGA